MDDELIEELLLRDCKPYLEDFKSAFDSGVKKVLKRGMLIQPTQTLTKIKVDKDRKPTNTSQLIHKITDQWFYKKFGIKARSQTIFCTSSAKQAREYGFPFMVFPIGEYNTLYSNTVDDLFIVQNFRAIMQALGQEFISDYNERKAYIESLPEEDILYAINEIMSRHDYHKNDLSGALQSQNEIMVECDYYYVCKDNDSRVLQFLKDYIHGRIS